MTLILLPHTLAPLFFVLLLIVSPALGLYAALPWLAARTEHRLTTWSARWPDALREHRTRRLAWGALLLAAGAALLVRPGAEWLSLNVGLWLWLLAGALLGGALWLWPHSLPVLRRAHLAGRTAAAPLRWGWLAAGVGALLALAGVNHRLLLDASMSFSFHAQIALLAAGCACLVMAFPARAAFPAHAQAINWPLVGITLLAFAVNTWQLGAAVHSFVDEFHSIHTVKALWDNPNYAILQPYKGIPAFPAVYTYGQMIAQTVLGHDLTGLRILSAVFGTLTVPALYLLARELFDRRTALLAALLLATFPPHIHFSRLGLNNIADPLFGVLALAFLVRALKRGGLRDYALSGVMLGLTQYFYEGGKLLYPLLFAAWLLLALCLWQPWAHWRGLLVLVGCFVLVAFPPYYLALTTSVLAAPRLSAMNVLNGYFLELRRHGLNGFLWQRYMPHLLHFIHQPDISGYFYTNQTPLILGYLVPAFMLGVFAALWRLRLPGLLLLLWLAATIIGNSLVSLHYSARFVVAFPAVALLLALGIRTLWPLLWPQRLKQARGLVALRRGGVFLLALLQVVYYFGPFMPAYNDQLRIYEHDIADVMYRARDLPPETTVYLYYDVEDTSAWRRYDDFRAWWGAALPEVHISASGAAAYHHILHLPEAGRALAFFAAPDDLNIRDALRRRFGAVPPAWVSPYNVPPDRQYVLYYIPARGR